MAREFSLIVACCKNKGIGLSGKLPWELPEDLQHFKAVTTAGDTENTVIMGRKTWESIPAKFRPLPKRKNIVISQTLEASNFTVTRSLTEALTESTGKVFIIGGYQLFQEALSPTFLPFCQQIYLTRISTAIESDVFFPSPASDIFQDNFLPSFCIQTVSKTRVHNGIPYDFVVYHNTNLPPTPVLTSYPQHEEYQYLDLIKEIISKGLFKNDRTKVGTFSLFGRMSRYDLHCTFPLFTTKLVFWKGVVEELLWFIKGSTDANELSSKGVGIWDANGSREFLDNLGFVDREVGDLGPVYGFQWRHFGAEYAGMRGDYSGQGVDQLKEVIELIKNDPCSRRIIMSAWNPVDRPKMALPPCHVMAQFIVEEGKLSCLMFQRSGDVGLGVPFNVASYSLLTCLIAQVCGLERGEFVHVIGDTHVYSNHVEPLKVQIERHPMPFPQLKLNPQVKEIFEFTAADIKLENYVKHGRIKMDMAV